MNKTETKCIAICHLENTKNWNKSKRVGKRSTDRRMGMRIRELKIPKKGVRGRQPEQIKGAAIGQMCLRGEEVRWEIRGRKEHVIFLSRIIRICKEKMLEMFNWSGSFCKVRIRANS